MNEEHRLAASLVESLDQAALLEFDRIANLAAQVIGVPISLVSFVEEGRQVFAGVAGLAAPYCDLRETPLSHSFCQTVIASRTLVVVSDASQDDRFRDNPALQDLGVLSYLGFPLADSDGTVLGAFCLIDTKPHDWNEDEIDRARDFAAIAATQVQCQIQGNYQRNLLDILTHDLKNPLSALDFSARLLLEQRETFPSQAGQLLEAIIDSSTQAFELLKQVGKRQAGDCEGHLCALSDIVSKMLAKAQSSADAKSITLHCDEIPAQVSIASDLWLVERVLENLISNAIKYTPRNSSIEVRFTSSEGMAGVCICDKGPGFSEQDKALLYQRYVRLSALPSGGESSSGLGLSIAKRLASLAGGSLQLTSQAGESACFEILFPVQTVVRPS